MPIKRALIIHGWTVSSAQFAGSSPLHAHTHTSERVCVCVRARETKVRVLPRGYGRQITVSAKNEKPYSTCLLRVITVTGRRLCHREMDGRHARRSLEPSPSDRVPYENNRKQSGICFARVITSPEQ